MRVRKLLAMLTAFLLPIVSLSASANESGFIHGTDTWYFSNSPMLLGNYYRLTPHDQTVMEETLSHIEHRVFDSALSQRWQGCCYGFAVTTILNWNGILTPQMYQSDAKCLHDVQITEDVVSLLNYYQQMQCMDETRQKIAWDTYYRTSDERLMELLDLTKAGTPTLLCYQGHFRRGTQLSGHAVVAYGYESGNFIWEDRQYDGKVLLYDNNLSLYEETACLYVNSETRNWCIPGYQLFSEEGAEIGQVSANLEFLNNKGLVGGTDYHSDQPPMALLSSALLTGDFDCTRTAFDGAWLDTKEDAEIKRFQYTFGESIIASDLDFIAPDAGSGYHLHTAQEQAFDLTMFYPDLLLIAEGIGQDVRFSPDGTMQMEGTEQPYRFELVGNEGHYYGSYYDVVVSGIAKTMQIQMTDQGYLLTSDSLQDVQITASNDHGRDMLELSVDANCVLIYETESHRLAAAMDKDGDGIYETAFADMMKLGDVNVDGIVDSTDAAEVLIAAVKNGAGEDSGLTQTQKTAADVDNNGALNAADAAMILFYAAEIGAGSFSGSFAQFMEGV